MIIVGCGGSMRAAAMTHYVRIENPSPAYPYSSWDTAATNIQDAVTAAAAGSLVLVSNGVYAAGGMTVSGDALTNRVAVTNAVTLRSVNGPDATWIVGAPSGVSGTGPAAVRAVYLAEGAVLIGFTVTNGHTLAAGDLDRDLSGGGIWAASTNVMIEDCRIVDNHAQRQGGGVFRGTLLDCEIRANTVQAGGTSGWGGGACFSVVVGGIVADNWADGNLGEGGGVYDSRVYDAWITGNRTSGRYARGGGARHGELYRCRLVGNFNDGSGSTYGGGAAGGTLYDCLLISNWALDGGGAAHAVLVNCTLIGNTARNAGGGVLGGTIRNSIVYYNEAFTASNYSGGVFVHSCAWPRPAGTGNIEVAPGFTSLASPRLLPDSPCRDAGDDAWVAGAVDIEGYPRIAGAAVDMGAYEVAEGSLTGGLQVAILAAATDVTPGHAVRFSTWIEGRAASVAWDFGDGVGLTNAGAAVVSHAYATSGVYRVGLTVTNRDGVAMATATVRVWRVEEAVRYASPTGGHRAGYAVWADAATNLQDAVDATPWGGTVWADAGMYATGGRAVWPQLLRNRVVIDKPVSVRARHGPGQTLIVGAGPRGDEAVRGVYMGAGAVLIGFTVTNGFTRVVGEPTTDRSGGGIWAATVDTVTVSNCVITGNEALLGGGVYRSSVFDSRLQGNATVFSGGQGGGAHGATLWRCVIVNNTSPGNNASGGGVQNATLYNCLIAGNYSRNYGGGGAHNSTLYNCTVAGNLTFGDGGGTRGGTVCNSIVHGNDALNSAVSSNYHADAFQYSMTWPLPPAGAGNMEADPLFLVPGIGYGTNGVPGDYRLHFESPAIEAGANQAWMIDAGDLDGHPRILKGWPNRPIPESEWRVDMGAYEYRPPRRGIVLVFR